MSESFEAREQRIAQMENRLMALKSQQKETARKRETKRLILMGRLLENLIEWDLVSADLVTEKLDGWLTRDYDRFLFNLPPVEKAKNAAKPSNSKEQKKPATSKAAKGEFSKAPAPKTPPLTPAAPLLQETGVSESEFLLH